MVSVTSLVLALLVNGQPQPLISTCGPKPGPPSSTACFTSWCCDGVAWEPCQFKTAGTACDDGNACTYNDKCDGAGDCAGTPITCSSDPPPCGAIRSCNESSTCSVTYPGTTTSCDDNNACTYGDHCSGSGTCVGTAITCTSTTCAILACNGTATCTVSPRNAGASCDDGNPCTYNDRCDTAGNCAGTPIACTPVGPCQTSQCNGTSSCTVTLLNNLQCRAPLGPCDYPYCDGTSALCPSTVLAAGTACPASTNPCEAVCDGASVYCQPQ